MGEHIESTKSDLERALLEIDLQIKEADLAIKNAELTSTLKEKPKRLSASSPLSLAIITGILGLIGAGVANVFQTRSNLQLEREKLESSLILKAIETGNTDASAKNLLFLLDMKLITDPSGNIAKLKTNPQDAPVLSSSGVPIPHNASSREVFFNKYKAEFGSLPEDRQAVLTQLFSAIEQDKNIKDVRHVAYILATIKWETADRWQPITEYGTDSYFDTKYGPNTSLGRNLGNTQPGDGSRYKGRGYVQIVGRDNYRKVSEELGLAGTDNDLVEHPEKALEPLIAYRVTSYIMVNGGGTGHKLGDFIDGDKTDYINARRIINGLDKAETIADSAKKFEAILRASLDLSKNN